MSGKESTVSPQSHRWNSGPALRADDLELKATIASRLAPIRRASFDAGLHFCSSNDAGFMRRWRVARGNSGPVMARLAAHLLHEMDAVDAHAAFDGLDHVVDREACD